MKFRKLLALVLVTGTLGMGCSDNKPVRRAIQGEAFCNGDKLTVTSNTHLLNARLQVRGPDGQIEIAIETKTQRTQEWVLGQVTGRQPTRMTAQLKSSEGQVKRIIDGKPLDEAEKSPLAGVLALEFTRTAPNATWTKTLSAGTRVRLSRNADLLKEAEFEAANAEVWNAKDELYPDEPIATGHQWIKTGTDMRPLLGMEVLTLEGEARFRVSEFKQFKGLTCALVAVEISSKGTLIDPTLGQVEFTFTGSASIIRSTRHGIDLLMSTTGTLEQTARVTEAEGTFELNLTGSMLTEESIAVERIAAIGQADSLANVSPSDQAALTDILEKASDLKSSTRKSFTATTPAKVVASPKTPAIPKAPLPIPKAPLVVPTKGGKAGALLKMLRSGTP